MPEALIDAAMLNKIEVVEELLTKGYDPNITNRYGMTPITWAVINNKYELVKMLVKYGAKLNISDTKGTPLIARVKNTKTMYNLLVSLGADTAVLDEARYQFKQPTRPKLGYKKNL